MKLIEVALPLESINQASKREKSIRHGHPSTLHLWWARRPLAACRAVLFAQLVDDPSTWPEQFPTEQDQEAERKRLFEIIEQIVQWENGQEEKIMQAARREIAGSIARARKEAAPQTPDGVDRYLLEHAPQIRDPFCGGGAIPLEAQRLGLSALGSDLNPVAVMVSKATCELPARFSGMPPVSRKKSQELSLSQNWQKAAGLAEDIDHYARRMREEAWKRIGHLYPKIRVTDDMAEAREDLKSSVGRDLTVIAWIWARTVASPEPSKRGYHVPLVRSFDLSIKKGRSAWVEPVIHDEAQGFHFAVKTEGVKGPLRGTVTRQGGVCLLSGAAMPFPYIRAEGQAGRMGSRLMAIVAEGRRGRVFLPPTREMEDLAQRAQPTWKPDALMPVKHRNFQTPLYGMPNIGDLFTDRQLVALTTFSDLIAEVRAEAVRDAEAAGMSRDQTPLADGGAGAIAYGEAIATYLALGIDKASDYWSSISSWGSSRISVRNTFARQAIPMVWDFSEANPFSSSTGNWLNCCQWISKVVAAVPARSGTAVIQADAATSDRVKLGEQYVFATDPPYYDNIGYADLSDFFYVWLRRALKLIWPELFVTLQVPKADELIASPHRHGGRHKAQQFFMERMRFALMSLLIRTEIEFPSSIFYAYKQTETDREGAVSTGWASFLQAAVDAGFAITGTWPIRTELSNRPVATGTNALASSVVLTCRKRPQNAVVTTRGQFLLNLRKELPTSVQILQSSGIAPVDLAQAAVGQGMRVFTRYREVLESDDSSMSVRTALQLINTVLDEALESQDVEYDRQTRFALTWFESFGMEEEIYGEAEKLSVAKDVSVDSMNGTLLNSRGGKVRLLKPEEIGKIELDDADAVWKCAHYIVWLNNERGELATAQVMATLAESKQNAVKEIAYRLYRICENKRWTDLSRDYNGLIASWEGITLRAQELKVGQQQQLDYSEV